MTPGVCKEVTRFLTATALGFGVIAGGALAAPAVSPAALSGTMDDEGWLSTLIGLLQGLRDWFAAGQMRSEDAGELVDQIRLMYRQGGIPPGADPNVGRDMVAKCYRLVLRHAECAARGVPAGFLADLLDMYTDLGGNPLDLLLGAP